MMTKPLQTPDELALEAAAYHEAGHAVAALRLGYPPTMVTIVPGDDFHGQASHPNPLFEIELEYDVSDEARLRVEEAIMISLAGPLAQRRYSPDSVRLWHAEDDVKDAAELANRVNGSNHIAQLFLDWLEARAQALVEHGWPAIEAVANALMKQNELTQLQFMAVIEEQMKAAFAARATPAAAP